MKYENARDKAEETKEDEPAEDDEQDDPDEARPAWAIRDPGEPTAKEIEQHRMTGHIQFRIWCPYCLASQGKERAHLKAAEKFKNNQEEVAQEVVLLEKQIENT